MRLLSLIFLFLTVAANANAEFSPSTEEVHSEFLNLRSTQTGIVLEQSKSISFEATDNPVSCASGYLFTVYGDTTMGKLCYCNGSKWCPIDGGDCGTAASCD